MIVLFHPSEQPRSKILFPTHVHPHSHNSLSIFVSTLTTAITTLYPSRASSQTHPPLRSHARHTASAREPTTTLDLPQQQQAASFNITPDTMGFLSSSTSNSSSSTAGSGAISSAEYFAAEHRASMASAQNGRSTPLVLSEPPRPNRDTQYKTKNHAQKSNPLGE